MIKEYDKLGTRLSQILTIFNDGRRVSVSELSLEFNVDKRTIQRDLIRLSYLPIEKKDGYYYIEESSLGRLSFKDIKQFATFSGIRELYPELSDALIIDTLNARTNKSMEVRGHKYEDLSQKVDLFNAIAAAIVTHFYISFQYTKKFRKVQPYKLINNNGIWYLVGLEEGVLKNFSFSKIEALETLTETFTEDESILKRLKEHNGLWFSQNYIEVVLEINVSVADYFLRRELLPNQKTLESSADLLILSTQVAYEEEILKVVRYWMPHIVIRSPKYLQDNLEESLKKYLKYVNLEETTHPVVSS